MALESNFKILLAVFLKYKYVTTLIISRFYCDFNWLIKEKNQNKILKNIFQLLFQVK